MANKTKRQLYISKPRNTPVRSNITQKLIIAVIIVVSIIVLISVSLVFLLDPEHRVKSDITTLATDYYENFLYQDFANTNIDMSKYESYGFARITLRQLLLHDHEKHTDQAAFLSNYCDENTTAVKFFPEPPYTKTSYRIEYHYSCSF